MASRSPSRSDGEVLSSDSEAKANTSRSSRNDTKVDRPTRLYPVPNSPTTRDRRSRSRSPYRASRGEKRRREDNVERNRPRQDPRTFHVRYEDDRDDRSRYSSHDRHDSKRLRLSRSRSRSRSRSPYRHTPKKAREEQIDNSRHREAISSTGESTRRNPFDTTDRSSKSREKSERSSADQPKAPREELPRLVTPTTASSQPNPASENVVAEDVEQDKGVVDEAVLIEERRKRREALKNKYRGQATPLLVQALHLGEGSTRSSPGPESPKSTSMPTSPAPLPSTETREASPAASPRSTQPSEPQTPTEVNVATDRTSLENEVDSPPADEPSAADYDPTVDMQEERARHDKRLFKEDEQSIAEAESKVHATDGVVLVDSSKANNADFDMFADDVDEDDMFAEAPLTTKAQVNTAQALDARLMDNWDDAEGYYITILGELLENRYHVTQNLGRGMFSSVVRAEDSTTKQPVAIKIIRNNESMRKAAVKEVDILKDLAANDPEDKKHMIRLLRSFDHKGHFCMVFENLSLNLREVLKKFGRDIGINIKAIRAYAQQLFLGLSLLRKCQYLHADLKPDNILVNEARNVVKICDLGSASPASENATAPYLISRFYRAPEVILGIPYDYGIDMWSIGCTLYELYTGKILFTGRNNNNMLRTIMECRGKFPHKLLRRGTLTHEYFDDLLNFRAQETDKTTGRTITKLIDIKAKPVRDLRSRLMPKGKRIDEQERKELELFLDLLDKCLDLRPDKRITPTDALKHPFFVRTK
jgi:serine/threonine-protein kinase PRP4